MPPCHKVTVFLILYVGDLLRIAYPPSACHICCALQRNAQNTTGKMLRVKSQNNSYYTRDYCVLYATQGSLASHRWLTTSK